jgi:hypothetical protein
MTHFPLFVFSALREKIIPYGIAEMDLFFKNAATVNQQQK